MTNPYIKGDTVRINLPMEDPLYIEYHNAVATVKYVSGNSCVVHNSIGTVTVSSSELEPVKEAAPAAPEVLPSVSQRRHVIELDARGYIELLQLAFRHGNGESALSETTVAAISYAKTKYV